MNSFAAALRNYQEGTFSREDLEQLIDQDIGLGTVAADDLMLLLNAHHNTSPLAEEDFQTIRQWISRAETRQRTRVNIQSSQTTVINDEVAQTFEKTEITVGSVINGRFELEAVIGSGGMSQVFKAIDRRKVEARSRDPYVAVKVMDVRGIEADQAFVAMQREVQKSQSLTHQNIVRVNDFDRDGDIVFTTMELLNGESLQQKIARFHVEAIDLKEAIRIIHDMAAALQCAHENNIVHADFKPSNVFLTSNNRVKVIDFGIARAVKRDDTTTVADQTAFDARELGAMTPAYASPEMIEDLEPHPRDDIYALGCVAYELVTGMHPYSRLMATDARDRGHPLAKPANLNKKQWAALERTLHFDPFKRTSSVREFLDEFLPEQNKNGNGVLLGVAAIAVILVAVAASFFLPLLDRDVERSGSSVTAANAKPRTFSDCPTCPMLVTVNPGLVEIGAKNTDQPGMFEFPAHNIAIFGQFAISTHEITVDEFQQFADASSLNWQGCQAAENTTANSGALSWRAPGFAQSGKHPVTCVSWQDAQQYAAWLSGETGYNYRLPSEAEWEFAARTVAQQPLTLSAGGDACNDVNIADATASAVFSDISAVDCTDGFAYTAPVNRHEEGNLLNDMRGNVFEWTQDCWNPNYEGAPADGSAWLTGDCTNRVLRGGSWFSSPEAQRLTYRNRFPQDYRSNTFGFRLVRAL